MSENLREVILLYTTESPEELKRFLKGLPSREREATLIELLIELLSLYLNDKNSSRLRELVTLWMGGWTPHEGKLGYDGYRRCCFGGSEEWCEVKPRNTDSQKLDGGGSFNDYTPERLRKDEENNPTLLISGFVRGKLIYIFEIKFSCIAEKLRELLKKRFGEELKREKGEYLRSAAFSFSDYENCKNFRLAYLCEDWETFKPYLNKELSEFLSSRCSASKNT